MLLNKQGILDLLDELRCIAQLGLQYAKNEYDIQRYKKLLHLSCKGYETYSGLSSYVILERFQKDLGYVTPKLGVNGAVFNEKGELLLERRSDDGLWGVIGGWAEVGESPQQSLEREFLEETNLVVEVKQMIGIFTRLPQQFEQPHTSNHLLFYCERKGRNIEISHESLEVGFFDHRTLKNWHRDHQQMAEKAYEFWLNRTLAI